MKVTEHVEHLLRQGRSPKELVELGFPKRVVTMVSRKLRREKAAQRVNAPKPGDGAKGVAEPLAKAPESIALTRCQIPSHQAGDMTKADAPAERLPEVMALVAAAQEFGAQKRQGCPQLEDGLCLSRAWTSQDEIPEGIGEPVFDGDGNPQWHIKPSPFYCAMCTVSTTLLEDFVDQIQTDLSDDPLAGAKHRVICPRCRSKGCIAITVECTKCGCKTQQGWYPRQGPILAKPEQGDRHVEAPSREL